MQIFNRLFKQEMKKTTQVQDSIAVEEEDSLELDAIQGDMALIRNATELQNLRDKLQVN